MATPSANSLRALVLASLVVSGCSGETPLGSKSPEADSAADFDAAPAPAKPRTDDASVTNDCEAPQFPSADGSAPFERLSATVVDDEGKPVVDQLAQACGIDVCLARTTSGTGDVDIRPDTLQDIRRVAFKYGDGLRYAQFALLLDPEQTTHEVGTQTTLTLPPAAESSPLEPGSAPTSNGVRLVLADDSDVQFDLLSFPDPEQHVFLAAAWPGEEAFPQAAQELDLVALWALGPLKTEFCPPAALSLPNNTSLPAGTELEVLLHVTDVAAAWGEYGSWGPVARAQVSEDGARIETVDGSGIPQLGAIGLRVLQ